MVNAGRPVRPASRSPRPAVLQRLQVVFDVLRNFLDALTGSFDVLADAFGGVAGSKSEGEADERGDQRACCDDRVEASVGLNIGAGFAPRPLMPRR
ncbi:MAG: hypothetical protein ACXW3P_02275 [Rhodospirillales bacterium]